MHHYTLLVMWTAGVELGPVHFPQWALHQLDRFSHLRVLPNVFVYIQPLASSFGCFWVVLGSRLGGFPPLVPRALPSVTCLPAPFLQPQFKGWGAKTPPLPPDRGGGAE